MTWTRLSDTFADRPEVMALSDSAFRAHIEALVWANRQLTDGKIPHSGLRRILTADPDAVLPELEAAGLWEVDGTDVEVDWSEQEPAERVKERKDYRAAVQARYRERQSLHLKGDHSKCLPQHCRQAVTGNKTGNKTPSRPDPTRPLGRGGVGRSDAGSAPRSARATRGRKTPAAEKKDARPAETPPDWLGMRMERGHHFMDDGSGQSCARCNLSPRHVWHQDIGEDGKPLPIEYVPIEPDAS